MSELQHNNHGVGYLPTQGKPAQGLSMHQYTPPQRGPNAPSQHHMRPHQSSGQAWPSMGPLGSSRQPTPASMSRPAQGQQPATAQPSNTMQQPRKRIYPPDYRPDVLRLRILAHAAYANTGSTRHAGSNPGCTSDGACSGRHSTDGADDMPAGTRRQNELVTCTRRLAACYLAGCFRGPMGPHSLQGSLLVAMLAKNASSAWNALMHVLEGSGTAPGAGNTMASGPGNAQSTQGCAGKHTALFVQAGSSAECAFTQEDMIYGDHGHGKEDTEGEEGDEQHSLIHPQQQSELRGLPSVVHKRRSDADSIDGADLEDADATEYGENGERVDHQLNSPEADHERDGAEQGLGADEPYEEELEHDGAVAQGEEGDHELDEIHTEDSASHTGDNRLNHSASEDQAGSLHISQGGPHHATPASIRRDHQALWLLHDNCLQVSRPALSLFLSPASGQMNMLGMSTCRSMSEMGRWWSRWTLCSLRTWHSQPQ